MNDSKKTRIFGAFIVLFIAAIIIFISAKVIHDNAAQNCETDEGYYVFKDYNLLQYSCDEVKIPNHIHYAMLNVTGNVDTIIGYHIGKVVHFAKENNITTLTLEGNKEFRVVNKNIENNTEKIVTIDVIKQTYTCSLQYIELMNGTKYFGKMAYSILLEPKSFGLEPERNLYASSPNQMEVYRFGFDTQIDDSKCIQSNIMYEVEK